MYLPTKDETTVNEKRISILIVDDQRADRISTSLECKNIFSAISDAELSIEESATLENAYQKVSEQTFHIILLDKDLGEDGKGGRISGIDYISAFMELQPHAQIFMIRR